MLSNVSASPGLSNCHEIHSSDNATIATIIQHSAIRVAFTPQKLQLLLQLTLQMNELSEEEQESLKQLRAEEEINARERIMQEYR